MVRNCTAAAAAVVGLVATLAACAVARPVSAAQVGGMPSVTLEIIVKFASDSDAGRRIDRLLGEGSQDLSGLAETEENLENSTEFALQRERITSGRELIFSIPERPLLEKVETGVAQRADVESAQIVALQSDNPRLPEAQLLVRFRDSSDAADSLKRADGGGTERDDVRTLAAEIGAASGVPVTGVAQREGTLALIVDRNAVLETLTARINDLDYVDYAQPNATMQIMK